MSNGPFDIFLKLDGIDGESTVKGHENETVVLSYEEGIAFSKGGKGGGGNGTLNPLVEGSSPSALTRFARSVSASACGVRSVRFASAKDFSVPRGFRLRALRAFAGPAG